MGISEWAICDAFEHCRKGRAVFYVLPTQIMRSTFVQNRIDKPKAFIPYYAEKFREFKEGADSTILKHFGQGVIKLVGSNAPTEFGEFPANCVTIDERDWCNQDNLLMAKDRLQASKIKYYREISKPSIEADGIDKSFSESDQKLWHIKCKGCNEWQALDFFTHLCREVADGSFELLDLRWNLESATDLNLFCNKCGRALDRLQEGEFVPFKLDRRKSGYHLSHLFSPTVFMAELWEFFLKAQGDETWMQVFYNSRLGLAYTSKGAKLTQALMEICMGDFADLSTSKYSVAGIDVGAWFHVIIRDKDEKGNHRLVHAGSYKTKEELKEVLARFDCAVIVGDAKPETRLMRELQKELGRKFWLCDYFVQPSLFAVKKNEDDRTLQADRTQTMDSSHADFLGKRILLPKNFKALDKGDFVKQMCAPTRVTEPTSDGGFKFVWREPSGVPDHYRHAYNYAWIGANHLSPQEPFLIYA